MVYYCFTHINQLLTCRIGSISHDIPNWLCGFDIYHSFAMIVGFISAHYKVQSGASRYKSIYNPH